MYEVIQNIYTFEGLLMGRVYLLKDDTGLTLIDTSIANAGQKILNQLEASGFSPQDVKRILITHAHPDHVGGLPVVQSATGAEVWCHELEKPVIEGEQSVARRPKSPRPPDTKLSPITVTRTLSDNEHLPILDGLKVAFTPGHAPGHISFWHESSQSLIIGDSIFYFFNRMTLPLDLLTVDRAENLTSVKRIYDLQPENLFFGHGNPILGKGSTMLQKFMTRLDLIEQP
ncbi:MAG: MBL fold metallo-hydrolase [Phototrophicaceae bacterium]